MACYFDDTSEDFDTLVEPMRTVTRDVLPLSLHGSIYFGKILLRPFNVPIRSCKVIVAHAMSLPYVAIT